LKKVQQSGKIDNTMSSFAVIKSGGKQHRVSKDQIINVEKISGVEAGDTVTFEEVLLHADDDKVSVGTPTVKGKKVSAKVVEHGKAKKISVLRFKSKSNYRKKTGHRQQFTTLQITSI
jgi:large subunit ribosomal protein L21